MIKKVLYIQGYDNLVKELQYNNVLKTNINDMVKKNSSLRAFYDNNKYIVLKMECIDDEEDDLDNIYILNGNGIEFIDDKDTELKYVSYENVSKED